MMLVGTGISAAGSIAGGISANKTAKANAAALEEQARLRQEKGKYDIETQDRQFRRQQGKVLSAVGASGVSAASFLDILADDAAESALEKQAIKFGADADSSNLKRQASIQRQQGRAAMIGSIFSAAGSLASGYGKVTSYGMKAGYGEA